MVKFINKLTNSVMWVTDERVEEYKAAGHTLAADSKTAKTQPTEKAAKPKRTAKK